MARRSIFRYHLLLWNQKTRWPFMSLVRWAVKSWNSKQIYEMSEMQYGRVTTVNRNFCCSDIRSKKNGWDLCDDFYTFRTDFHSRSDWMHSINFSHILNSNKLALICLQSNVYQFQIKRMQLYTRMENSSW